MALALAVTDAIRYGILTVISLKTNQIQMNNRQFFDSIVPVNDDGGDDADDDNHWIGYYLVNCYFPSNLYSVYFDC